MFQGLTGWHFLIILAVILLLFGAAKLPALAKSMGQSARVFKGEMKAMKEEDSRPTADGSRSRPPQCDASATPTHAPTRAEPQTPSPDRAWPRQDRRASTIRTCRGVTSGCRSAQHLVELRKRLMFAALALVVGMVVAFFITDPVIYLITEPIRHIAETRGRGREGRADVQHGDVGLRPARCACRSRSAS